MKIFCILLALLNFLTSQEQVHRTGQACTHFHATSDINAGTFADARIAQSNVTQYQSAIVIAESQITNLVSDLAAKQSLNSNLTTFGGLTLTNDNLLQVKAGAWTARTPAQLKTDLAITEGDVSSLTTDLAAKAALASPTFTGTPAAPTAAFNTNTTQVATTAYVVGQGPVYARVTGSNATTTGQTLVNVTGLSVALTTNAVYEFEAFLSVSTTAVTTGTEYGVNYSVAGGTVEAFVQGSLTSASDQTVRLNALNTATVAYLTTSAQTGGILIKGTITTGANAGNLTIQHLKVTSGTSTVFINSYLKVTRIS
jgi:hypothetical protein